MNYVGRKDGGRYVSSGASRELKSGRTYVFSKESEARKFAEDKNNAEVTFKHGSWSVTAKIK